MAGLAWQVQLTRQVRGRVAAEVHAIAAQLAVDHAAAGRDLVADEGGAALQMGSDGAGLLGVRLEEVDPAAGAMAVEHVDEEAVAAGGEHGETAEESPLEPKNLLLMKVVMEFLLMNIMLNL